MSVLTEIFGIFNYFTGELCGMVPLPLGSYPRHSQRHHPARTVLRGFRTSRRTVCKIPHPLFRAISQRRPVRFRSKNKHRKPNEMPPNPKIHVPRFGTSKRPMQKRSGISSIHYFVKPKRRKFYVGSATIEAGNTKISKC